MAYDNIKLEKGLYSTTKGFTKTLEELDPSENYIGTELEGLDAYQRQLKRYDIKVSGHDSDTVDKFFAASNSSVLFPEYISRAVRAGIDKADDLSKLIATTTKIDTLDYRTVEIDDSSEKLGLANVAEGSFIPEAVIKTGTTLTRLTKRGRMLVTSYEAVRYQKLDLFTIILSRIGASIARDQLADACKILSSKAETVARVSTGELTYGDIVRLWNSFSPFNMNTLVCDSATLEKLLAMSEFRDSNAGLDFHATGSLITPLGAQIVKVDNLDNGGKMIGLDRNCALEKVQAAEVMTDFDRLIDRQLERASVTEISGFSLIFKNAVKLMEG